MDDIRLFLSYSRKDAAFQEKLKGELDRLGIQAWRDINHLRGGEQWRSEIQQAIAASSAFVLTLSPQALLSENVQMEVAEALRLNKKIIPIPITELDGELPEHIADTQWITQFRDISFDEGIKQLLLALLKVGVRSQLPLVQRYENYLRYTIDELAAWKTRYTPLFASFEKLTVFARLRKQETNPSALLDLINNHHKLVILGPAGSGKTTTLQTVTQSVAEKAISDVSKHAIPIYVSLRDYQPQSLNALIETGLRPWGIGFRDIEEDLDRGRFVVVLDGLNEVSLSAQENAQKEIRSFLQKFPRNHYIITSRIAGYKDTFLAPAETPLSSCLIQGLDRSQIREYVQRYFGKEKQTATKLLSDLHIEDDKVWESQRSLARLATAPLLLQMLILTYEQIERLPRNEGQLLLEFVDAILLRETEKSAALFNAETKKSLLATVAWEMSEHQSVTIPTRHIKKRLASRLLELQESGLAKRSIEVEDIWEELLNNGAYILSSTNAVFFVVKSANIFGLDPEFCPVIS